MMAYLLSLATQAGIFALMALALNLQWGYAGLLNFGLAGFFALGAYAHAIATTVWGWPAPVGLAFALACGAALAWPLGLASIRLRVGFYLAITTLGLGEVVRAVIVNEDWLTRGTRGIPVAMLFPGAGTYANRLALLAIVLACCALLYAAQARAGSSPFGRTLKAIRDDEDAARSLGKPVARFKIQIFMLGSAVMAGAGALGAVQVSYIVPEQFLPIVTFNVWMALIIGGSGSNPGAILGCLILVAFLEGSRFLRELLPAGLGIGEAQIAAARQMVVGAALTLIPMLWPRGILGRKED